MISMKSSSGNSKNPGMPMKLSVERAIPQTEATAADADHDEVFGNLGVYGADIIDGDGLFGYSFLMEMPAVRLPL